MLGGVLVGEGGCLLVRPDHHHLTVPVPCFADDLACAEGGDLTLALVDDGLAERARRRDEDRRRGRAVLGLTQEVARDDAGIGAVVGDDQDLGRPGQQVDADGAEDLTLGFRHVLVARADDHGDGRHGLGAEGHGAEGLHAADAVDLIRAGGEHRVQRRRVDGAWRRVGRRRRRAGDDALDAGHLGGHDAHQRRGDQRVAAARHVRADRLDRDEPLAQVDTRLQLHVELAKALALAPGKRRDLVATVIDDAPVLDAHPRDGRFDLTLRQPKGRRRPPVEPLRPLAHGLVAALADSAQDLAHGLADGGVVLGGTGHGLFQVLAHTGLLA